MSLAIEIAERRWLGDKLLRLAMRKLMQERLNREHNRNTSAWIKELGEGPVAIEAAAANEQHYEVPAEFFRVCLGQHLKYSCGLWDESVTTLDQAEAAMLALSCERAQLADGQNILELGCGWGSLSLWMAEKYPGAEITSVSNSHSQRDYIEQQAKQRDLQNLNVITKNMRDFSSAQKFDRVVSIEMFEHMSNYRELLHRISQWLTTEGQLFVHIFCHKTYSYPFTVDGENDWMARHFFTGGIMPSFGIFEEFSDDLQLIEKWQVNGEHYQKTANAWLQRLDQQSTRASSLLDPNSSDSSSRQLQRWRMFFMACAELFGLDQGQQWFVGHYRLGHKKS